MRLRAASKVFVGAEAPLGVAAAKSVVQAVPAVEVQVFRRLARVLTLAAGEAPVAGKAAPGEVPLVRSARLAKVAKALARPWVLVAEEPRMVARVMAELSDEVPTLPLRTSRDSCEEAAGQG